VQHVVCVNCLHLRYVPVARIAHQHRRSLALRTLPQFFYKRFRRSAGTRIALRRAARPSVAITSKSHTKHPTFADCTQLPLTSLDGTWWNFFIEKSH
jgi:hypothetical protein